MQFLLVYPTAFLFLCIYVVHLILDLRLIEILICWFLSKKEMWSTTGTYRLLLDGNISWSITPKFFRVDSGRIPSAPISSVPLSSFGSDGKCTVDLAWYSALNWLPLSETNKCVTQDARCWQRSTSVLDGPPASKYSTVKVLVQFPKQPYLSVSGEIIFIRENEINC